MNLFEEAVDALFIDALGGFKNVEVHADGSCEMHERLQIFREAESAEAESSLQKLPTDARVEAHGVSHFIHVGADAFAKVGEHIGVADLERKERIGSVLDQFGAVDGGDEKWRVSGGGAAVLMNRAREFSFENRAINLPHLSSGCLVFDTNDDSIGMKEIFDRCTFAQEFRVGNDVKG